MLDEVGWLGPLGPWTPPDLALAGGDPVVRDVFGEEPGEEVPYTVVVGPGRLVRLLREELDLAELGDEGRSPLVGIPGRGV